MHRLQTVGKLASGIVHDFNNALGAVLAYVDLQSEVGLDESQRRLMGQVRDALMKSTGMLQAVSTYALRTASENERVSVRSIIDEVSPLFGTLFKRSNIERIVEHGDDVEVFVRRADAKDVLVHTLMHCLATAEGARTCRIATDRAVVEGRAYGAISIDLDSESASDEPLRSMLEDPSRGLAAAAEQLKPSSSGLVSSILMLTLAGGAFESFGADGRRQFRLLLPAHR